MTGGHVVKVLKRPPHDEFTLRLFFNLSNKLPDASKVYLWSMVLEPDYTFGWSELGDWKVETGMDYRQQLLDSIHSDVVVMGIKDHLSYKVFNPWTDKKPFLVSQLDNLFNAYPDKKFILFTSLEKLDVYLTNPNLTIIPWGGDLTNQAFEYKKLQPVTDKNFDSPYTYLSLNRNHRGHRVVALSTLYGLGLEQHGLISCMFKHEVDELPAWPFTGNLVQQGFEKLKVADLPITDDINIYGPAGNTNAENFDSTLRNYYQDTFVEIINETTFTENCFLLTEKTLNSIYGCNFPILLSSAGSVEFLRSIGFDMFDDVVDHSYDLIADPIDRIHTAIYNNKDLLTGGGKQVWLENKDRFLSNIKIAKTKMYNFYTDRAKTEFMKLLDGNL